MRWEPAIYEHKAALIGKRPVEVAMSAELLTEAVLREFAVYRADLLTVGLDVYNLEVEALNARLICPEENACPETAGPVWELEALPTELALPRIPDAGRFGLLLDAGQRVRDAIGERTHVRVAASGPVTIAAKLVGLEALVVGLMLEEPAAARLLDFTTELAMAWCGSLRQAGLDAILFDSAAAPPTFSPGLFRDAVFPRLQRVMSSLTAQGQTHRPLIIGGDTTAIAADLVATGATMLICDFGTDAATFAAALPSDIPIEVRRNVNPLALSTETVDLPSYLADLGHFPSPIAGTGILPYDFNPADYLRFREALTSPPALP
jgi:uroporphyrinogen decarboxylase